MKKLFALAILILTGSMIVLSQEVPQAMTYKAIAKDTWGISLSNKPITLRFTIIEGTENGFEVYRETHNTRTSSSGLIDVKIGRGTSDFGTFDAIDWSTGVYYIRIEMDPKGGSNFTLEDPPHQLVSVPYALYAGAAVYTAFEQNFDFSGAITGDLLQYDGTKWVKVSPEEITTHENDPVFDAWDKSSGISITESQISDLGSYIEIENDPVFGESPAGSISEDDIANWNNKLDSETDPSFTEWDKDYNDLTNKPTAISDFAMNANSQNIINLADPVNAQDAATRAYVDALKTLLFLTADPGRLLEKGVSVADLLAAGVSLSDLQDAGFSIQDLFNAGAGVGTLEQNGADPQELADAGLIGTLTDVDGNTYKWVKIGTQVWMAENLKATKYNDGSDIPLVEDVTVWSNMTTPGYCWYNNNEAEHIDTYGALYNGFTINTDKLCPAGWHVPTDAEWITLENYLIENGFNYDGTTSGNKIAKALAAGSGWWESPDVFGAVGNDLSKNNSSGFSAIPGGIRSNTGLFTMKEHSGYWWSGSEYYEILWHLYIRFNLANSTRHLYSKNYGISVRCVRDDTSIPPEADFSASATTVAIGDSIHFTDQSTNNPTAWSWDFGDGGTSNEQNPSHDYFTEGTYTVSLTVTNSDGSDTETKTDYITVTSGSGGETGTFADPRDGNEYNWVKIGDQTWMVENLAYLPSVGPSSDGSQTDPYYYVYDYQGTSVSGAKATTNYQTYGVLYNWPAAMDACPAGWHLPSDDEWKQLELFLGMSQSEADNTGYRGTGEGSKLKSESGWFNGGNGTNESGFTALPGGRCGGNNFIFNGEQGFWWSATTSTDDATRAWSRNLGYNEINISRSGYTKHNGFSVRCVRDDTSIPPEADFAASATTVTIGDSIHFTDQSTNNPTGWSWDFGDGGTSNEQNPSHDYFMEGTYTVSLTVTNSDGSDTETKSEYITVTPGTVIETGTLTDTRDDHVYQTVKIGDQWWMAENLKYLPSVVPRTYGSPYETTPYYYVLGYFGNNVEEAKAGWTYTTYGVLYNWSAAMAGSSSSMANPSGVQGVCPTGWHLPSDPEWLELTTYLGGEPLAGGKLKETGTTHWFSPNSGATNESGFTALPGGYRHELGEFDKVGYGGYWWSATENDPPFEAWNRLMLHNESYAATDYKSRGYGFSVRCVKDDTSIPPEADFAASATTVTIGDSIHFTDQSTNNPTGWSWDFGDGGTSNEQNPSHDYFIEGTYTVSLTVTNSDGSDTETKSDYITVTPGTVIETGTFTDPRDGNDYNWVKIGDQTWMAENLAYLPSVGPSSAGNSVDPYYYVYDYQGTIVSEAKATANYQTYGALYNWPAAMAGSASSVSNPSGVQGVCPAGWHLPSDAEWTELENYLIANGFNYDGTTTGNKIAKSLATASGWSSHYYAGAVGNTDYPEKRNATGFSSLPGGRRYGGSFDRAGDGGYWWSAAEYNRENALFQSLNYIGSALYRYSEPKTIGCSVRCLRDN